MGLASLKWMSCCSILQTVLTLVLLHEPDTVKDCMSQSIQHAMAHTAGSSPYTTSS